jgi:hypothetical protein
MNEERDVIGDVPLSTLMLPGEINCRLKNANFQKRQLPKTSTSKNVNFQKRQLPKNANF